MSSLSPRRHHIATPALDLAVVRRYWTYATTIAGVYLAVGFMFYYSAKEKLVGAGAGTMPAALRKEFSGSLLATVPGEKPVLFAGLGVSMLTFGLMGLANNMVGDLTTSLTVFTYLGLTAVVMVLVRQLAPYRSANWLSGFTDD